MIHRKKYEDLLLHVPRREHTILIGARQTGKSTLLKALAETLRQSGENVVVLNLERKDILLELNQSPERVFRYISQNTLQKSYLLIEGWA